MPGPDALKPGDVIQAMNKVTIEVDNTDAEGRLILADGLCYASDMKPKVLVDVATLTGACVVALGNACTGVYTTSNHLWSCIETAGVTTNDFMWRMPLFIDIYMKQLKSQTADLNNIGGREAGSCTAATFLSSFVDYDKVGDWAHLDIAGTFMGRNRMTGRPTRALIQLAQLLSKRN
jgi:aminopeptidase